MPSTVKYMVVSANPWGRLEFYKVIDTSLEGNGRTVGRYLSLLSAHRFAKSMNNAEGYEYAW